MALLLLLWALAPPLKASARALNDGVGGPAPAPALDPDPDPGAVVVVADLGEAEGVTVAGSTCSWPASLRTNSAANPDCNCSS